jgi:predicted ferric reductase
VKSVVEGSGWIGLFVGVAVAPLVFAVIGVQGPGRGFVTEFSVALGFVGLALMGLQFALVARFRGVAAPFGTDALAQFHRQIGLVGFVFVVVHVALSAQWEMVARLPSWDTPWRVRFGVAALLALVALVTTSIWRRRLRLSYEVWHVLHGLLAVTCVGTALVHVLLVDHYIDSRWKQALWLLMTAAFVALLGWVRVAKPLMLWRRPWTIDKVTPERGRCTTLTMRPSGHRGMSFEPGQFAWFVIDRAPFAFTQHPFSFSSSAEADGEIEVTVKALGDFTAGVADLTPGTKVYVEGPYGAFTPDQHEGPGFCFIAGGVGVTPIVSILRTLADRGDRRPLVAFVADREWEGVTFREEFECLKDRLDLDIVYVLEHPPPEWSGETGRIDVATLQRHLPPGHRRWQFFICGPNPMMDAMEHALEALGVPGEHIHTERFGWV